MRPPTTTNTLTLIGGSFDSLADSLAQDDTSGNTRIAKAEPLCSEHSGPGDRLGETKTGFWNGQTIPRLWRSQTGTDSAACLGCDVSATLRLCVFNAMDR
jgi:hypothetical protein